MSVKHLHHVTLAVPDVATQKTFYDDFGLIGKTEGDRAILRCKGRNQDQVIVIPGKKMKLHDISFGTTKTGLADIERRIKRSADTVFKHQPKEAPYDGIWLRHEFDGMLYNINISDPAVGLGGPTPAKKSSSFDINTPGHYMRVNKKGGTPFDTKVCPSRLGHVVQFTTEVDRKIDFYTEVLGLKLTDRSGDFIAFLRVPGGSDHHVIAVIKDDKPGFHHTSFEVNNIDEMGIAGQRMMDKGYRNGWGIGRHALGSNFFWYIRDPHNGLAEYFSDIDYIADDRKWRARDWPMEVSFFLWGPPPPAEFGRNFESTRKTTKPKPLVLSRT